MRVLITGGAGFIGFNVAKKLLARGDQVVIVDNFNDYYDVNLKRKRASLLKGAQILFADISDFETMEQIFKTYKFHKICHLAAQAGVRYSLTNPFIYGQTNFMGTLNLLELCRRYNVKDFIYASSSSVYGKNEKQPFSELDRVDTPISLYAATKKSNEEMAHVYNHLFGINCIGLRFFTVYGPYGRPDMALFLFTKAILEGKPIKVFNNGNMIRDFTYIDDIVSGVIAALDSGIKFDVFNLARGEKVFLLDFIREIEKNLGLRAKKNMLPLQPGDVIETSGDITNARIKLGYNPKTSVAEGVRNFIQWYKEYYRV
jgi:UDP-glucuronate 4-epimerase